MALRECNWKGGWFAGADGMNGEEQVLFDARVQPCGEMPDVVVIHAKTTWLAISFADFEQMYNLAKAARESDD